MSTSPPASSSPRPHLLRRFRWLFALALCTVSLTSLALSGRNGGFAGDWLRWPMQFVRVLTIDDITVDDDDLVLQSPNVIERVRAAWWFPGGHGIARLPQTRPPTLPAPVLLADASNGQAGTPAHAPAMSTGHLSMPTRVALRSNLSYVDLNSAAYKRFKAYVDKGVSGSQDYGFAASDPVLMFQLTQQQKYCDLAESMVEKQVSSAESRISSGSAPTVADDSYLDAGPMIADLSMTYTACAASLTADQKTRWAAYAEQTVWNIWNFNSAKWGGKTIPWSGWSVSNPGNNYYYSFLQATMFWALASDSQTWMDFLKQKKLPPLLSYFAGLPGGGSLEGTGYGTSHMTLFANYMVWRDDTGSDLANANPHATDSIRYWVHATVPTRDRFAPFGDQARTSSPDLYDYQRRVVLEARFLTHDADASNMASWWLNNISIKQMTNSFNDRYDLLPAGSYASPPADLLYQAKGVGQLFARTGWDTKAMWVAFIAGTYNESHAHQEQGGFTLFAGDWLAVTENIWTHSGIQQGTSLNNILRFEKNGSVVSQSASSKSTMTVTPGSGGEFTATADLKPAYGGNSAVTSWKRQLDFAGRKLTVTDKFGVGSGTTATFQLNVPAQPKVSGNTVTAGNLVMKVLSPANPTIKLVDWKSVDSGEYIKGWRIDVSGSSSGYKVELTD